MKKESIVAILVLMACALFLSACKQDPPAPPTPTPKPDEVTYTSKIEAMVVDRDLTVDNTYKSDFFRKDSSAFDKDLALLSGSMAFSSSLDEVKNDMTAMYFDDIYVYSNQGSDIDVNGCSYVFGHRAVDSCELISIHVFGMNYGAEWAGNLTMGSAEECNGDHLGFNLAAGKVYDALKDYIAKNLSGKDLKIWICGYSRAGAISGVLACDIIEGKELRVSQKDMYVYTFEAPVSISTQRVQQYSCIHNIVVEADIVPHIIPESYGISRPGKDIVMSALPDYVNECLHKIVGEEANMPTFTPDSGSTPKYNTPAEFVEYLIEELVDAKAPEAGIPSLESRAAYVSTIQERGRYLAEVLMKDHMAGADALAAYVKEVIQDFVKAFYLVAVWTSEDGFYGGSTDYDIKGLKQILDESMIGYDDAKLKASCSLLSDLKKNDDLLNLVTGIAAGEELRSNAIYTVTCHYPGVIYSLLKCYDPD